MALLFMREEWNSAQMVCGAQCDNFWGPLNAQVVCRQLGHASDGMIT